MWYINYISIKLGAGKELYCSLTDPQVWKNSLILSSEDIAGDVAYTLNVTIINCVWNATISLCIHPLIHLIEASLYANFLLFNIRDGRQKIRNSLLYLLKIQNQKTTKIVSRHFHFILLKGNTVLMGYAIKKLKIIQ